MKFKVDRKVMDYLSEFDLTEREIIVYLTLLRTGPNTIMNLARETGIKRSTTHNNVEELVNKGLVSQTNYGERRMVVAEEPEKLKFLIEQKKWTVKKLEKGMDEMISSIYKVIPDAKNNSNVDVRYYEGTHNVFSVYQKSLKADEVFSFVNLDNYFEVYPETSYIWEKALDDNEDRVLYALTVDTEMARGVQKSAHKRYHSKFLKGIAPFGNVDIHIYDNEVAIIKLDKEKPSAIVINSDIVASSLKAIHQLIWGITE